MNAFESIEKILSWISTHGLATVEIAIVLFIIVSLFLVSKKYLVRYLDTKFPEKPSKIEYVEEPLDLYQAINSLVDDLRIAVGACRSYVFDFHNGDFNIAGIPIMKMTCRYEATASDAQAFMSSRKSMPLQMYETFVRKLINCDYTIMDVRDRVDAYSEFVWGTLVTFGTTVKVSARITDRKDRIIGYLGVDYCNGDVVPPPERLEKCAQEVAAAAKQVGLLWDVKKRK